MAKTAMVKRDETQLAVASEVAAMFGEENAVKIPVDAPLPQVKILQETPQFELPDGGVVLIAQHPESENH